VSFTFYLQGVRRLSRTLLNIAVGRSVSGPHVPVRSGIAGVLSQRH